MWERRPHGIAVYIQGSQVSQLREDRAHHEYFRVKFIGATAYSCLVYLGLIREVFDTHTLTNLQSYFCVRNCIPTNDSVFRQGCPYNIIYYKHMRKYMGS